MTTPPPSRVICRRCSGELVIGACSDLCPACLAELALMDEPEPQSAAMTELGDYELLEELGRGGMGVVWRARQRSLNRIVALKTLTSRLPGEDMARRFQREAEAAAALRHPNIVAVYEVGESEGCWYLSMELVEGGSLADRVKRDPLPPREVAAVVAKVARAVQHAHERGVLHRDLKPANILLDTAGEPCVADFGLARIDGIDVSLTHSGLVLGTPAYMSPEQAAGRTRDLTTASDIYSLGTVLYELLTERPPFTGNSSVAVLRRVADEEPARPSTLKRGLDADLETICLRCMEKEPTARYRTMLAVANDLERWMRGEPILARPVTTTERVYKWARRHPAIAALWGAVAALVLAVAVIATALSVNLTRYNRSIEASANQLRQQLAQELAGTSHRLVEADDSLRALAPLAEAIRLGTGNPLFDRANRVRYAALLRASPELGFVWADGRKILRAETDRTGSNLLLITPRSADLWSLHSRPTLKQRWLAKGEWRLGAISGDGERIVLSTLDERFVLYDAATGSELAQGEGGVSTVGAFANRNRSFITFKGATAWLQPPDGNGGQPLVLQHPTPLAWAAILPWQRLALTRDTKGLLYLWTTGTVPPEYKLITLGERSTAIADFSGDRGIALQGGRDIFLLDALTGEERSRVEAVGRPQSVGFDGGGGWVYLARRDTGVDVREVFRGDAGKLDSDRLRFTASHGALGFRGAFAPGADLVATQSWNGSTRVWKISNGRAESPFLWQAATPGDCLLDQDGRWLITRSDEPAMRLWWLKRDEGATSMEGISYDPVSAWVGGTPETLYLAERNGRVHRYDPSSRRILKSLLDHGEPLLGATSCNGGDRVFTYGSSRAQVCDAASGATIGQPLLASGEITCAAAAPDGRSIAAVVGGSVIVWDCAKGTELCRIAAPAVRCEFSRDGGALLLVQDGGAQVYQASTGAALSKFVEEPGKGTEARFSPDGTRVLQWSRTTVAGQNAPRIWNASTSVIETVLEPHWRAVDDAAFSPDGRLVASGGEDHVLRICDARTGLRIHPPRMHRSQVRKLGFSPDGLFVWAVSDNDVHIWDTAAALSVGPRLHHPKDPVAFAWSKDGQHFFTAGDSFSPRKWSFVPDSRSPEDLQLVARAVSAHDFAAASSDLRAVSLDESREAWNRLGLVDPASK